MNQQTTDKIRQIIVGYYECGDIFTPFSSLTGRIISGNNADVYRLAVRIDREFSTGFAHTEWLDWKYVQDVFDSVEAAL